MPYCLNCLIWWPQYLHLYSLLHSASRLYFWRFPHMAPRLDSDKVSLKTLGQLWARVFESGQVGMALVAHNNFIHWEFPLTRFSIITLFLLCSISCQQAQGKQWEMTTLPDICSRFVSSAPHSSQFSAKDTHVILT